LAVGIMQNVFLQDVGYCDTKIMSLVKKDCKAELIMIKSAQL